MDDLLHRSLIRYDRLDMLATHLERGTCGHARFDFRYFYLNVECGTAGCALGEMPFLDKEWIFVNLFGKDKEPEDDNCYVILKSIELCRNYMLDSSLFSAMSYFSISEQEANHLFIPGSQDIKSYSGTVLTFDATKEEVASNMRAFIAHMRPPLQITFVEPQFVRLKEGMIRKYENRTRNES